MKTGVELLGDTVRAARIKKGYTQETFSEMLNITPVHLANIEGSRRKPSVPLLFQMMKLLDFSVDALVFQPEEKKHILHLDGLSDREIESLSRLVDAMKE